MTDEQRLKIINALDDLAMFCHLEQLARNDVLEQMRAARAAGASLRQIADAADCSHQTVANRLNKQ